MFVDNCVGQLEKNSPALPCALEEATSRHIVYLKSTEFLCLVTPYIRHVLNTDCLEISTCYIFVALFSEDFIFLF